MCEMKTIPGVLRNKLNVNLDAGLLLFWTLVYCCFGRLSIVVLDACLLLFWRVCFVIWRRPVVGASGGTFS